MKKNSKKYVIGVDGGGTKTVTALADLDGNILKIVKTGPSSPRNVGIKKTVENVAKGIKKAAGKKSIAFALIGLPAVQEEYRTKISAIKKKILKEFSEDLNVKIDSDQLAAFRSGSDEKTGVLLIAGTGCAVHGWRGGREEKVSGWGWLADEGSAFWTGKKTLQTVFKDLDGRSVKSKLTKLTLENFKVKTAEKLAQKIYKDSFVKIVSSLSAIADQAAKTGDKTARQILREAGDEAATAVNVAVKKLGLKNKKFPLVLVGSMFKSNYFKKAFELYIKETCSKAEIIYPKDPPVSGAVKLALENIVKN